MDAEKYALGLRSVIMESQWMQSATRDGVIPFWKSAYDLQNTGANCTAQIKLSATGTRTIAAMEIHRKRNMKMFDG